MDRATFPARTTAAEAAALIDQCAADTAATLTAPISLDLLRVRAVVAQRKAAARFTVAEVSELERTHRALVEALEPHRQDAFSLADLSNSIEDAGYEAEIDERAVYVRMPDTPQNYQRGRLAFVADLALAAPRYVHAIMTAARWVERGGCYVWDRLAIEREAA